MEGRQRKVPVVYYLCRNMNLEQPHFVEVPCSSDGLYLRDVMNRLNLLRGKGMAAMYSWSCKRSYKSGFVWQDLSEEDLIIPAQGKEYVLKGSERLNASPSEDKTLVSDRAKTAKPCPELVLKEVNSPWRSAQNASTQTDERAEVNRREMNTLRTRGVSTDDSSLELQFTGRRKIRTTISKDSSEINADEISPPPTSSSASSSGGKTETLETLIRADAKKTASFRVEEEVSLQTAAKLKATEVLMQLITCGSIAVKDSYGVGTVSSYRPRISRVKMPSPVFSSSRLTGDLDGLLMENPRTRAARRIEEKVFFSGSLLETQNRKNGEGKFVPSLKRSSSYNEERSCKSPVREKGKKAGESGKTKGLRTIKNEDEKKTKSAAQDGRRISAEQRDGVSSRISSKRFTEASPATKNPSRTESFREDKDKIVKIEERLTSGARVVIHSTATCHESEDSWSS